MRDCDHSSHLVYARRTLPNGSTHFCVQCLKCLDTVKLAEHDFRPFIRVKEIPAGQPIYDYVDRGDAQ